MTRSRSPTRAPASRRGRARRGPPPRGSPRSRRSRSPSPTAARRLRVGHGDDGGQRARPRPHRRRPRRAGRGAAAPVHLRRDAGLDRPHRPDRRSTTCSSASTRCDTEVVERRAAPGSPATTSARGAVDLAVWDLVGKVLDRPCHTLLGGYAPRRRGRAHGLVRQPGGDGRGRRRRPRPARACATFKVKVGREPDLDVAATRAIRDALPGASLYVDANRGWSYDDALRAGDALLDLGVRAIEEPISVDDRAGRLRLAERWPVPLVGDESCISLAHVDRALEEGAVRA